MRASISAFWGRLIHYLQRSRPGSSMDSKLGFYCGPEIEKNLRQRVTAEDERRLALGGIAQTNEKSQEVRGVQWLDELWRDLRYSVRSLRNAPDFSITAILTLAVGVGTFIITFSIVDGILYRPMPYQEPDRIVRIMVKDRETVSRSTIMPIEAFNRFQRAQSFVKVAAYNRAHFIPSLTLTEGLFAERLQAAQISESFLPLLGVQPCWGRGFQQEDIDSGRQVAILCFDLWQRSFGADKSIIGRTITFAEGSRTIIGIMPASFRFPTETPQYDPQILLPMPNQLELPFCTLLGRLKPGVTLRTAQAEAEVIIGQVLKNPRNVIWIAQLRRIEYLEPTTLLMLLGGVLFLVMIACVNVVGLFTARNVSRQRELAIRSAIGAESGRLLRQLMTESIFLSAIGGLVGVILAYGSYHPLVAQLPSFYRPLAKDLTIDFRALLVSAALTVIAGTIFGLVSALEGCSPNLSAGLKPAENRVFKLWGRCKVRGALLAVEVALSLVLLTGSALLLNSFIRLLRIDLGFDPANVSVILPMPTRITAERDLVRYHGEVLARLRTIPGIRSVALAETAPFSGGSASAKVAAEGREETIQIRRVTAGYFDTLSIACMRGRLFVDEDANGTPEVAVISESMARRLPNQNALGQLLIIDKVSAIRVVGVVHDTRSELREPSVPMIYIPIDANNKKGAYILCRVAPGHKNPSGQIRSVMATINKDLPVKITKLQDDLDDSFSSPKFFTLILGMFAAIAIMLTTVGITGLVRQSVARRRHEIGVRLALGARRLEVVTMIVRQILTPVLLGLTAGIAGALALTHVLVSLLFEIEPWDPITFLIAAIVVIIMALLACFPPARRAAMIDPLLTLRCE